MGKKPKAAAYVVCRGRKPGIYFSWPECEQQVHKFPGADFQGYPSLGKAQSAWEDWQSTISTILQPTNGNAKPLFDHDGLFPAPGGLPAWRGGLERPTSYIDLTVSDDEETKPTSKRANPLVDLMSLQDSVGQRPAKKHKLEGGSFKSGDEIITVKPEDELDVREEDIQLTPAQQAVVQLALKKHNIFLTGAAGSGKTATLKEILRLLKARYRSRRDAANENSKFPSVQVVAPTGIAALPLDGKTSFSFAGWNPDSFQKPMGKLCEKVTNRVIQAVIKLEVLVIEEISMVENQFLERLNILLQYILKSNRPFGGKQVIFVGDFHQLPPVKPFEFCLACGEQMARQNIEPVCEEKTCRRRGLTFKLGDKWAFRAPIWAQLGMKHIKLDQIHRQKDTRFQDILNKIRNRVLLTDQEWNALTAKKDGTYAVKLMSRRKDVIACNEKCLASIRAEARSWEALDSCRKLRLTDEERDHYSAEIERKAAEHKETLKDHRFPTTLTLKVGAKVVLLSNINPTGGLVNGSQGEVVKFVNTESWPCPEPEGKVSQGRLAEQAKVNKFQEKRGFLCPVVRFHNGKIVTVQPVAQESLRGPSNDKYAVCRAQIPLALAWALSIHKSQGMTLSNVEVSSDAIFESGQLYVGLSRATKMEGLEVIGYSREQLEMDEDVLDFYQNAPWEDIGPTNVSKRAAAIESMDEAAMNCSVKHGVENNPLLGKGRHMPKVEEF